VKLLRRIHLYLGCFITPLLAVYLFSGFYFILKPERQKDEGEAQTLMQKFWWMHTDQQWPRGVSTLDPLAEYQPKTITTWEADITLFKWLVYMTVIIALATMILGLVLAIRSAKDKKVVMGVVIAGILIPIVFLTVGQKQVKKLNPFHPDNAGGNDSADPGLPPPGSNIGPGDPGLSPLPTNPLPGNNEGGPSLLPPGKKED
jgi:amino acid transporter